MLTNGQTVLSIEIITVSFAGFMAVLACYDIARKNARQYLVMIILATAEIYGGKVFFLIWRPRGGGGVAPKSFQSVNLLADNR